MQKDSGLMFNTCQKDELLTELAQLAILFNCQRRHSARRDTDLTPEKPDCNSTMLARSSSFPRLLAAAETDTRASPRCKYALSQLQAGHRKGVTKSMRKSLRHSFSEPDLCRLDSVPCAEPIRAGLGFEHITDNGDSRLHNMVTRTGQVVVCGARGCRPVLTSNLQDEDERGTHDSDEYFREALIKNPNCASLLKEYARYLVEVKKDIPGSERIYNRALALSPHDADMLTQYAHLLWEKKGEWRGATVLFERAVKAAPNDCYVHAAYASFLFCKSAVLHDAGCGASPDTPDDRMGPYPYYTTVAA
eukprot:jgi/Mesvir1/8332/Mv12595-RA.1